ncbi:MAG TPA: sigma-70 family RNA polymerase sigma factor [Candidatus Krumholzibacteria bacterium]|nr:sigma-70 family RNA polymerase sigma factor [Candidatus Krumholzibacteria bacterium]
MNPKAHDAHSSSSPESGPATPSDEWTREELEGVRRRDPQALERFFERTFDSIYGLSFRLLSDRTAAEDATQEVFLKVHRAAHRIDPQRDPTPWILTITTNVCRDLFRSSGHKMSKASVSIDEEPELGASLVRETSTPEAELLQKEQQSQVQAAIGRLPEALREVIVLHDYQGLGHQEIAEIVKVSYGAVRKRYSRALSALGEILEEIADE